MKRYDRLGFCLLISAGALTACSGFGTAMTHVGRLRQNKGYEMKAELPAVEAAATAVLKARGYDVSVKPDAENGAEGAGRIVIGQSIVKDKASPEAAAAAVAPAHLGTRDLVDVYLSKKWQLSDNQAVPNVTLVEIVGSEYVRVGNSADEVETPHTKESMALLRDDIERETLKGR
jgi:hypothetical protein